MDFKSWEQTDRTPIPFVARSSRGNCRSLGCTPRDRGCCQCFGRYQPPHPRSPSILIPGSPTCTGTKLGPCLQLHPLPHLLPLPPTRPDALLGALRIPTLLAGSGGMQSGGLSRRIGSRRSPLPNNRDLDRLPILQVRIYPPGRHRKQNTAWGANYLAEVALGLPRTSLSGPSFVSARWTRHC